jgi:O-methyltransferase involved in polyketide biosynthesis
MEKLSGVSETLLITLYFRYIETLRDDGIIRDEKSIEIVEKIDVDLSKFANDKISQFAVAVRTKVIDEQTINFLDKNPDGVVVNLAAGLCTRFFRIDNGNVIWYNIDLEEVQPLWIKLIGENPRHKFIAHSVLDSNWVNLPITRGKNILFILEGLSMYLSEEQMQQIFRTIKTNFPNSELLFDAISESALKEDYSNAAVSKTSASFTWGIENLKEVEAWENGIILINEWHYFDMYIDQWKSRNLYSNKMLEYKTMGTIGHIKFM